jgi:hypothetical protein
MVDCRTVVRNQLLVVSKSLRGEGRAIPPFRQKRGERMGHGALVGGQERNNQTRAIPGLEIETWGTHGHCLVRYGRPATTV